jgi:hypothetical protein
MQNNKTKTLILNRQQLGSFREALMMTANRIAESFIEDSEAAPLETLHAVSERLTTPAFVERIVTFPGATSRSAAVLPEDQEVRALVVKGHEVDYVADALASLLNADTGASPEGVNRDLQEAATQLSGLRGAQESPDDPR